MHGGGGWDVCARARERACVYVRDRERAPLRGRMHAIIVIVVVVVVLVVVNLGEDANLDLGLLLVHHAIVVGTH